MNKKTATAIAIAISIIAVFFLLGRQLVTEFFISNSNNNTSVTSEDTMQEQTQSNQVQARDTVVGTGDVATAGKTVTVHYTGVFTDGKKFDSSRDRDTPFTFVLGAGQVIKGWDTGLEGMKVGGKRILVIPPQFGYGDKDFGPIPANSTLIFEVELLSVK